MFSVSNDDLRFSLSASLRNSLEYSLRDALWESLCDALSVSLKSVYKGVEYVLCV